MKPKQILWDWNGTLLDDLEYAIGVRNRVFPRFGLKPVGSVEEYHAQFTFPVREYYERAGATEENFDQVAHAWMDEYVRGFASAPLHGDALAVLERFRERGLAQGILSASHREVLAAQLRLYGLENSFDFLLALDNIYAGSKEHIGCQYLRNCGVPPEATVMLGDTLHDGEVAAAMGVRCGLIARGHQSRATLEASGWPVFDSLTQAADWALALK